MSFKSLAPAYIHSQPLLSVNSTCSTKDSLHCSNLLKLLPKTGTYPIQINCLNSQILFLEISTIKTHKIHLLLEDTYDGLDWIARKDL